MNERTTNGGGSAAPAEDARVQRLRAALLALKRGCWTHFGGDDSCYCDEIDAAMAEVEPPGLPSVPDAAAFLLGCVPQTGEAGDALASIFAALERHGEINPRPQAATGETLIEAMIEGMGGLLETLRRRLESLGMDADDDATNYLDGLVQVHLPKLDGAAGHPDCCGAIGALVWGSAVIAPADAEARDTGAGVALQIGRVYLETGTSPASDLLTIAAIVAARENARRRAEARP